MVLENFMPENVYLLFSEKFIFIHYWRYFKYLWRLYFNRLCYRWKGFCSFAGIGNSESNSTSRENGMSNDINASFSWKNNSAGADCNFGMVIQVLLVTLIKPLIYKLNCGYMVVIRLG